MNPGFVQKSLRTMAIFEAYSTISSLVSLAPAVGEVEAEDVEAEPSAVDLLPSIKVRERHKLEIPEITDLLALLPEEVRRKFPFSAGLDEISMRDLSQQCSQIAAQLKGKAKAS